MEVCNDIYILYICYLGMFEAGEKACRHRDWVGDHARLPECLYENMYVCVYVYI